MEDKNADGSARLKKLLDEINEASAELIKLLKKWNDMQRRERLPEHINDSQYLKYKCKILKEYTFAELMHVLSLEDFSDEIDEERIKNGVI